MRKWIVLAILLLLLAGLAGFALININSYLNRNKDWVAGQVESALGRKVTFDKIGLSLRRGLGLRVANLRVADDPSFSDADFLRAGNVLVRVKILPALQGRYEVSKVFLESPSLRLVRTAAGLNVATMGTGSVPARKGSQPQQKEAATPTGPSAPPALLVTLVQIEGGEIRLIDRTAKPAVEVAVKQIHFSASNIGLSEPGDFELSAAILGAETQNLQVSGSAGPVDMESPARTPVKISLDIDPVSMKALLAIKQLAAVLPPELSITGKVGLHATAAGTADDMKFDVKLSATQASVAYSDVVNKPAGVPMTLRLVGERTAETLKIDSALLVFDRAELNLHGKVSTGEKLSYDLSLQATGLPLQGWGRLLPATGRMGLEGAATASVELRGRVGQAALPALSGTVQLNGVGLAAPGFPKIEGLSATVTLAQDEATVTKAKWKLAGSSLQGHAQVKNLKDPKVTFSLFSPLLEARSLGIAGQGVAKKEEFHDLKLHGQLHYEQGLPSFEATVSSSAGSIRAVDYKDFSTGLGLQAKRAMIDSLELRAFGGKISAHGSYDMADASAPAFAIEARVSKVGIPALLASLSRSRQQLIEGSLDAKLSLKGTGKDPETIEKKLLGRGHAAVHDGALKDLNIADGILQRITGVPGLSRLLSPRLRQRHPELFHTGDTRFDTLAANFKLARGRVGIDDMMISAKDYSLGGHGSFGFDRSVDFTATFEASRQLTEDLLREVRAMKVLVGASGRLAVPFRLSGRLPAVQPQPDMRFVETALERALIGTVTDRLLGTPPPSSSQQPATSRRRKRQPATPQPPTVEEQIRRGLEGLFGR